MPNGTIYILVGGGCRTGRAKSRLIAAMNDAFAVMHRRSATVLIVPFARQRSEWKPISERYRKALFSGFVRSGIASVSVADPRTPVFFRQFARADLVFLCGGSELRLQKYISTIKWPRWGKIIVGISAGANVLAKRYFSNDRNRVETGLGVVPMSTICHYGSEKRSRLIRLVARSTYPVVPLHDDEYIVLMNH